MNSCWISKPPTEYTILEVDDGFAYIHKSAQISCGGRIGRFSYINHSCVIGGRYSVEIGSFCSIAPELYCWTCDSHQTDYVTTFPLKTVAGVDISYSELVEKPNGVTIGNDVWIGNQVRIMAGVTIGNGAVVASRAVVTGDIPPYCIYGGVPAKFIKKRCSDEIASALQSIAWWSWPLKKILVNNRFFNINISALNSSDDLYSVIV